jgi:hypothetical protein
MTGLTTKLRKTVAHTIYIYIYIYFREHHTICLCHWFSMTEQHFTSPLETVTSQSTTARFKRYSTDELSVKSLKLTCRRCRGHDIRCSWARRSSSCSSSFSIKPILKCTMWDGFNLLRQAVSLESLQLLSQSTSSIKPILKCTRRGGYRV